MALSGQLSDLSLAELIEFFCNQRKTGRLKIAYHRAPGYFYFDRGELVDAKIGALVGVDAVYYALTQENASFKFSTAFEATRRTIHQPWSHAVLEGLRRLDEGVAPKDAFPEGVHLAHDDEPEEVEEKASVEKASSLKSAPAAPTPAPQVSEPKQAPLSLTVESSHETGRGRTLVYAAVIAALVLIVAGIGFPAGWYGKRKVAANAPSPASEVKAVTTAPAATDNAQTETAATTSEEAAPAADVSGAGAINNAAARQQEREARAAALAAQERATRQNATAQTPQQPAVNPAQANKPEAAAAAPQAQQKKTVTVQVTYDEQGRVTQASGGDGMAQRIARQKRFPTGKGGTTTVTIPVN